MAEQYRPCSARPNRIGGGARWLGLAVMMVCGSVASCASAQREGPVDGVRSGVLDIDRAAARLRRIVRTGLRVDVGAHTATARLEIAPSRSRGISFEVGDLDIRSVRLAEHGQLLAFSREGSLLLVDAPAQTVTVAIDYGYRERVPSDFTGASPRYSFTWPYYCGNLFPCHSDPSQGTRFTLSLTGIPAGLEAIAPPEIPFDAPAYQLAWAVGSYRTLDLGATEAGTHLSVWYLAGHEPQAQEGTARLRVAFDWLEHTLGAYPYGRDAGAVEVAWAPGALGGMEHHPRWHVASPQMADGLIHIHEAAHGWFGDGIRIACWEDFVLSEGTAEYLAARAIGALEGDSAEEAVWRRHDARSDGFGRIAWPEGCGSIDVLRDGLFTAAPYVRGAHFYRALEHRIGRAAIDGILRRFVAGHRGQAARFDDMLGLVRTVSGYDAHDCAVAWLRPVDSDLRGPDPCP